MTELTLLLASYGLAFFLTHKFNVIDGRMEVLDRMMECSFCMGFHTGWVTYLLYHGAAGKIVWSWVPLWAFASATFVYAFDNLVEKLER